MTLKEGGLRGSLRNVGVGVSDIPDSVVTQYQFEDNSDTTTAIDSVGSNNANITGATYSTTAQVGSLSLGHDGTDDFIESQNTVDLADLGSSNDVSIMGWARPDTTTSQGPAIIWYKDANNLLYVREDNGNWEMFYQVGGTNVGPFLGPSFSSNTWYHLYAEVTPSTIRLYVDDTLEIDKTHSQDPINLGPMNIGTGVGPFNNYFDGYIDDAHYSDSTLTDSERQTVIDRAN